MPLILRENIRQHSSMAVWEMQEREDFFSFPGPATDKIRHPKKRLQHLAGRFLLGQLSPLIAPEKIQIDPFGRPYQPGSIFDFSISHSDLLVAAIVSDAGRVGIDIQFPDPKLERIKEKFLSSAEWECLQDLPLEELQKLTLAWTAKETLIKWHGKGGLDLKENIQIISAAWTEAGGSVDCLFLREGHFKKTILSRKIQHAFLSWLVG